MTTKLLNPGPVTLTERVRKALLREDMCHREPEFAELQSDVMARLARVYPDAKDAYVAVLMTGSGTCAVEAMIGSLVPKTGSRVLVVSNGVYGERAASMLDAQGKPFEVSKSSWTEPMNLADVEQKLATGAFTHVFAVHHETTTGRLNDVAALGKICKAKNVPLLLDAVSSFAGEEIRFEEWNLLACAATANKCLHAVPGIAFVVVKKSAFDQPSGATSVYLDLHKYRKEQVSGYSPFTQAVHVLYALQEALRELDDAGGWAKRHGHYTALTEQVMGGLRKLGIEIFLDSERAYSSILTSYRMPGKITYAKLHDHLKAQGFIIYAGQGQFSGSIFRIAVMGDLAASDITRLLGEIKHVLS